MSNRRFGPTLRGALGLALALAACAGQATPPPQGFTSITGSVTGSIAGEPALGAALLLGTGTDGVTEGSVVEVYDGFWLAGATLVDDDGGFQVQLPDGVDLPSDVMAPASDLIERIFVDFDEPCVPMTSNATTTVTSVAFIELSTELFTVPGLTMLTASGAALSVATPVEIDLDDEDIDIIDVTYLTWAYADAAVDVATPSGGCVESNGLDTVALVIDVSLEAGWNQLGWRFAVEPDGPGELLTITLTNDDASPVYLVGSDAYLEDLASGPF